MIREKKESPIPQIGLGNSEIMKKLSNYDSLNKNPNHFFSKIILSFLPASTIRELKTLNALFFR